MTAQRTLARAISGLLLMLVVTGAIAGITEKSFYGYAFDLQTNRYLYTEIHRHRFDGERWLGGTITYYAPDRHQMGKKTLDFGADPYVPVYRLELLSGAGYVEGITKVDAREIELFRRDQRSGATRTKHLSRGATMTADSGFDNFVRAHFEELMAGKAVSFSFVAAGALDVYRFRAQRIDDTKFEDRKVVRFRVEPDSLLRLFVKPLELTYDPEWRRLLEYRGVANLRDPATGDPYVARIAYYSQPPANTPTPPPLK